MISPFISGIRRRMKLLKAIKLELLATIDMRTAGNAWGMELFAIDLYLQNLYGIATLLAIRQTCRAWRKGATKSLDASLMQIFSSQQYRIDLREFRETFIWQQDDVDWTAAVGAPSSMLVPTTVGYQYVREVLAISFPSLCWLLRDHHTAEEIETAWLHMLLLKPGKSNRGEQKKK